MSQNINAAQAARDLLSEIGWEKPGDLSLEEIAGSLGAMVESEHMDGCEGRIIMTKKSAIIKINASITYPGKRNFVLGHEIGHFALHRDLKLFLDNSKTLSDWYTKGVHEQQANEFAEELLMPSESFIAMVKKQKLNIELIEKLANHFSVSLTAALIRYSKLGEYPTMVIYIEGGIIKWKMASTDFPFPYLPYGSQVPAWTVAGDYFNGRNLEPKPAQVDAIEWFPEDYKLQNNEKWKLWEQCFPVSQYGLIVCLWSA